MQQLIILAWRNLWRNRRRTLITLASVFMAVVLAIAIRSLQKGAYSNMIGNAVRFSTGYLQVQAKGYWEDKSINNSFTADTSLDQTLQAEPNISLAVPRLESFALASSGLHTKGVAIIGIDPVQENQLNSLEEKVAKGKYFHRGGGQGLLIGDGLANYLRLQLGDTLVLMGQGYHGSTAAAQYPIQGIFHFPLDQLNNSLVYLALPDAQAFFAAPGRLTSVSLMLDDPAAMEATARSLQRALDSTRVVLQWPVMNKSLVQEIQGDNAGGIIMLGILYLVVAFGVFGTILMMTMERKKEFAVMIAIGMHRIKLTAIVMLETVLIGLMGIVAGCVLILPVLLYLYQHPLALTGSTAQIYQEFGLEPIMPVSVDPAIFFTRV